MDINKMPEKKFSKKVMATPNAIVIERYSHNGWQLEKKSYYPNSRTNMFWYFKMREILKKLKMYRNLEEYYFPGD